MKNVFVIMMLMCFSNVVLNAQVNTIVKENSSDLEGSSYIIKGKLVELINNEKVALPFANIFIEGSTDITTSDFDGNFELRTKLTSSNLKCTFMGYESVVKALNLNGVESIEIEVLMKQDGSAALESKNVASKS